MELESFCLRDPDPVCTSCGSADLTTCFRSTTLKLEDDLMGKAAAIFELILRLLGDMVSKGSILASIIVALSGSSGKSNEACLWEGTIFDALLLLLLLLYFGVLGSDIEWWRRGAGEEGDSSTSSELSPLDSSGDSTSLASHSVPLLLLSSSHSGDGDTILRLLVLFKHAISLLPVAGFPVLKVSMRADVDDITFCSSNTTALLVSSLFLPNILT